MSQMKRLLLTACMGLLLCQPAIAARPFVTDDARLTTAGSCQLESWMRIYPDSRELWALPACNPFGNLELTLGGGIASAAEGRTTDYVFQLKTLFRPLATNGWGLGLAAGTVQHPEISPGPNQLGNTFAYLPLSVSLHDDRLILHANLGWLRDHASRQDKTTWGLGAEIQTGAPRLMLIAESFGDDKDRPYWQTGMRFALIPNLFQVDATLGQQMGGDSASRWLSLGLRWTPERLF